METEREKSIFKIITKIYNTITKTSKILNLDSNINIINHKRNGAQTDPEGDNKTTQNL